MVNIQSVVNAVNNNNNTSGDAYSNTIKSVSFPVLGIITALNCSSGSLTGSLVSGSPASGVSFSVPYNGGNSGTHSGQTIGSTGVAGLTATLSSGNFNSGSGNLSYTLSGTPATAGIASFSLNIGGQTCTYSIVVNTPVGSITVLNCGGGSNTGTLVNGVTATGVSFSIPYSGGNGGTHSGQTVTSTGVTGLTATLSSGNFTTSTGNLSYAISGTPSSIGTASFALNIGGQTCTYSVNVSNGSITVLNCGGGSTTGNIVHGITPTGVSFSIPYSGGNGGPHSGQTVTSTGVTGMTATLSSGNFTTSTGNLSYTISGTPISSGTASFGLNIGGQTCTYTITVAGGSTTGRIVNGVSATGVSITIPYTGGNGGSHSGQTVTFTGVTGLTATLSSGNFNSGSGNLTYTISGTPSSTGTASFGLNIGGQTCTYSVNVGGGSIATLNCIGGSINGKIVNKVAITTESFSIPYNGGNGGYYQAQTISSTGVTGLVATLSAGYFMNGMGSLIYSLSGTPSHSGTANFSLNIGGQSCVFSIYVQDGEIATIDCNTGSIVGLTVHGLNSSGVSFIVDYTGGNAGPHNGQIVNSTGVTGVTAKLDTGYFFSGSGTLVYNLTGIPTDTGVISFAINIGGQTCIYTTKVDPGLISIFNCNSGITSGKITTGVLVSGVSFSIPYLGGNGGYHTTQNINSTGVTGLIATLVNGNFNIGPGSLNFIVSGTPTSTGIASFALNIGGKSCIYTVEIGSGIVTNLNCGFSIKTGTLVDGKNSKGVSFELPYNGGNVGIYASQFIASTNITGLTATLNSGVFNQGSGSLLFTITGTPLGVGTASFPISIGGQNCTINFSVLPSKIDSLFCKDAVISKPFLNNISSNGATISLPYKGGNGGKYSAKTTSSLSITNLTASLNSGNFSEGSGSLIYEISGTPNTTGSIYFIFNVGGQFCTFEGFVEDGKVNNLDCSKGIISGQLVKGKNTTGLNISIPYQSGNGGRYNSQNISSSGVIGVNASLNSGFFSKDSGDLIYNLTGVPSSAGVASFNINIGGKQCMYTTNVSLPSRITNSDQNQIYTTNMNQKIQVYNLKSKMNYQIVDIMGRVRKSGNLDVYNSEIEYQNIIIEKGVYFLIISDQSQYEKIKLSLE